MSQSKLGVWLNQTDATMASGLSQTTFLNKIKPHLAMEVKKCRKYYFMPISMMATSGKQRYQDLAIDLNTEKNISQSADNTLDIDALLGVADDSMPSDGIDLQQARRREILTRTKVLNQKIVEKKHQIFAQWSQRFFVIFQKNFSKFKNTLIQLHLQQQQLKKLNENLNLALTNMESCLGDLLKQYLQDQESQ